jgi:hypothetical protein
MNVGGEHVVVTSDHTVPPGTRRLGVRVRRVNRQPRPAVGIGPGVTEFTVSIDGEACGQIESGLGFFNFISWSGLDIGRDRGSPVSYYEAPFTFTGELSRVIVTMENDQTLDSESVARALLARE